jgi:hypothetical protein
MGQNGSANQRKAAQDQEGTFSVEGWFSGSTSAASPSSAPVSYEVLTDSSTSIQITPGGELNPFNWSNNFLRAYADFEFLEQMAANLQNDFVVRKLTSVEDSLLASKAEADLLPIPNLRIRLEEAQANHRYSSSRQEQEELSEQLSMLRLNICSQALVRLALCEFHLKLGDKDMARTFLQEAEERSSQLQEASGKLECADYLKKMRTALQP